MSTGIAAEPLTPVVPHECELAERLRLGVESSLFWRRPADEQARIAARVQAARPRTVLRIVCPRGCDQSISVVRPDLEPLPQVPDPDRRSPYPNPQERAWFERTGQAVCEALLAHALFECTAFQAEDRDCGHQQGAYQCNLSAGHHGRHEVLEYIEAEDRTVTVAWWPNLPAVQ